MRVYNAKRDEFVEVADATPVDSDALAQDLGDVLRKYGLTDKAAPLEADRYPGTEVIQRNGVRLIQSYVLSESAWMVRLEGFYKVEQ